MTTVQSVRCIVTYSDGSVANLTSLTDLFTHFGLDLPMNLVTPVEPVVLPVEAPVVDPVAAPASTEDPAGDLVQDDSVSIPTE